MVRLRKFYEANAAVPPRTVTFVSGHLFFTRTLALPEGMRPADIESFAELTLEGMSPFSLEHLAWGYVTDPSSRWLLIMAACRPRLSAQELDGWGQALFVLPGFYPLLAGLQTSGSTRAIFQGECLTLANYEEGCPLPVSFTHRVIETEGDVEAEAFAVYAAMRPTEAAECGLPVLREGREEKDGGVVFEHVLVREADTASANNEDVDTSGSEGAEAPAEEVLPVRIENVDTLWPADLRDPTFKTSEQGARRLSGTLWKSMLIAGVVALVLILGGFTWGVLSVMQSSRLARIERQTPEIMALELKEQNLNDLKQFVGSPFRPFDILGDLNNVKRHGMGANGIYFDSVALSNDNEVTVRGKASNIVEVNRYADALKKSGLFEEINAPDYQSRGSGEARFTLDLRYLGPPTSSESETDSATGEAADPASAPAPEPSSAEAGTIPEAEEAT
ncbi:hypothetical protein H5P28_00460 [Ruficoccus amylovorans]|uniref:PilN domain-containing protein n=1 Tax=Ruficoccus amylovorans TaxID=1804625 RepID=A0A842H8L5_9BACT|nr:hypothetical protein [Ruficoccus amylovorans]MBC2592722.1 hypothetical protein [Ruficoccus amylovorans]